MIDLTRRQNRMQKMMLLLFVPLLFVGCYRGRPSQKPPIHLVPDMDTQPKYKAQGESDFFADGKTMRSPVPGTIPQGYLKEDVVYYTGKNEAGQFVINSPVDVSLPSLKRGQARFNIYCAPCHSRTGDGQGIIIKHGFMPPPSFHIDRIREVKDGYIFDVISNGVRNMPSYGAQIPIKDRWAIVNYVRALQRSQNATLKDVPEELRNGLK